MIHVTTIGGFQSWRHHFYYYYLRPHWMRSKSDLVLSLFISVALIREIKNDVNWKIFKRFVVGCIVGLPFGIWIFLSIEVAALKISVGIVILILTLLLMLNLRIQHKNGRDMIIGGLSGLFTTSIGMPGPPLLLYFSGQYEKRNAEGDDACFLSIHLFR